MFGYKRYSYSGRKRGYSYGHAGKYFRRGSSTARALGSARAAKNGSKLENYNCTVNGVVVFTQAANVYYSNVRAFSCLMGGVNEETGQILDNDNGGIYGAVVNDRGFRLRCAQYDEFRIVSMRVKLMPQYGSGAGTSVINPSAILSICDRCASQDELAVDEATMTDVDHDVPSPREIEESAGVILTQWNNNRASAIVRTVYARDLTEKEYSDCSIDYDKSVSVSPLQAMTLTFVPNFCPCIYFTIKSPTTTDYSRNLTFSYSVEYNVIFRNPKSDLQTFVIKENPSYVNPDSSSKYMVVKSSDPHIPDRILNADGKEFLSSWYARYKKRAALATVGIEPVPDKEEEAKVDEPMTVEDDPGTS